MSTCCEHTNKAYRYCFVCLSETRPITHESHLQAGCMGWFDATQLPQGKGIAIHNMLNQSNPIAGSDARLAGVKKSFPDITIFGRNGNILIVELKMPGKYPTRGQREVHAQLRAFGYQVEIAHTLKEFASIVLLSL